MDDPIPDYDLEQPSAADLVDALNQILGPKEAQSAVAHALRELGFDLTEITDLSPTEVLDLANVLTKQRGLVSVLARSFSIRLHSYQQLAELQSPTGASE